MGLAGFLAVVFLRCGLQTRLKGRLGHGFNYSTIYKRLPKIMASILK